MAGTTIKGGNLPGMRKYLEKILADPNPGVKVGVLDGATYGDGPLAGESVAQNLARHEFGAEIKKEARTQTLYFKQDKNGTVGNRFVKKDKSNFSQEANVGAHTYDIPARAPFRKTIEKKKADWAKEAGVYLAASSGHVDIRAALTQVGDAMAMDIQQAFKDGLEPALKEATIKRKTKMGYGAHADKPVMLTGTAQHSIASAYVDDLSTVEGGS